MSTGMIDYPPHGGGFGGMNWPGGSDYMMPPGWDASMFPHMDMAFPGAYPQVTGHGYPSPTVPPGVPKELHEEAHQAGMTAYQVEYQRVVENGLCLRDKLRQAEAVKKEAKEAMKEPMKIPVQGKQTQAKQPAPPANAPTALPSKLLPDPPKHDANGEKNEGGESFAPPPGLGLPEPPPPPGLPERNETWPIDTPPQPVLERNMTWPIASTMKQTTTRSPLVTVPTMEALDKTSDGTLPFQWSVDSRRLHTSDKVIVSPSFEWLEDNADLTKFKMMILPKAINDKRGGSAFKKSKGKAVVEIKCEANPPKNNVKLRLAVSDKLNPKMLQDFRGPVLHNFSEANICNIKGPGIEGEWDLPFDKAEAHFLVRLEIYE